MAKQSLKVVVAGRTYPLSVSDDEATKVENAAKDINKAIKLLQDSYAVKDMQDLLAMTALQLAVKDSNSVAITPAEDLSKIEDELNELIKELDK
ncbi:MAG: cell division protein ZapA [Crocinitomicaceae bacterium]|jgi:cell division protein ZapA (FtsZ GTPase activity inhibitor)|nr:cell division protein ZapA [Crocinitomicaceae bacterium]MDG1659257.1 cell division protein ZapA [Crocinitomicaceae bacterium]|tara:strand:- start:197 stop:478 length:282 start_codon:yes stop_codon:yes gene_type:complete